MENKNEFKSVFTRSLYCTKKEIIEGYSQGLSYELGVKDGRIEAKRKIAKKMLKMNMSILEVSEITGLSKSKIAKLKDYRLNY